MSRPGLNKLASLPATIWLVGFISLFNDAASDMIYPLVPLFLASVLMAGPRALGVIEGIAEATAALLKLFSGVIFDRTRSARPWIIGGYSLAGFARPLIALAASWPVVLLLRFTDRVGKGIRTSPRDALIAVSVTPQTRGLGFGVHRAMDNAGAVLGPLAAALLLGLGVSLSSVILSAVVPAVICLLLALSIKEPRHLRPQPAQAAFSWRLAGLPPVFKRYLVVLAIFTLGNASNMFLLLRARELGMSPAQVPLAWAVVSFVAMVFTTPLSSLSDRVGRTGLIIGGWLVYGLFYLALGLVQPGSLASLLALFACYGMFIAATEGVEKALVADLAPAPLLGTAFGWFNLTTGLLLLPASVIFGELYQQLSAAHAFVFSAVCALSAALLLKFWALKDSGEAMTNS